MKPLTYVYDTYFSVPAAALEENSVEKLIARLQLINY